MWENVRTTEGAEPAGLLSATDRHAVAWQQLQYCNTVRSLLPGRGYSEHRNASHRRSQSHLYRELIRELGFARCSLFCIVYKRECSLTSKL